MKYGMNLLLWAGAINDSLLPVLEQIKEIGYDGVEIPLHTYDEATCQVWNQRLNDLGLERTAATVRNAPDNPISGDPKIRSAALEATKRALDACRATGCQSLVGPFQAGLGVVSGKGPTEDEWKWSVEYMRQLAEYADSVDVTLAVEPLNRYEIYLLNAHEDAVRYVEMVNHPRCTVLYDTFHANIEEKNPGDAIRAYGRHIGHVHISENDRGTPGQGGNDWESNFDALAEIGYDGWMVVEAFGLALPEVAAATMIWRRMFADEMQLTRDALAFMQGEVAKR